MTIQDLGSIADLIAAVATVVALGYLAAQIRANTRAVQAESRRTEIQTMAAIFQSLVADREVARMFNAGLADLSSLSPEDRTRFLILFGNLIGADSAIFDEARMGVVPREVWRPRSEHLRAFLNTQGGRESWMRLRDRYSDDFRQYVEREILKPHSEPAA